MDRRGWGVVMLGITLVLAVTVPPAFGPGSRISGQAVRHPIPPSPAVGECLLSAADRDGSTLQYLAGHIAAASIGACATGADLSGHHNYGEIVAVTADQRAFPRSGGGRTSIPDPRACQSAADDYVGWRDRRWAPVFTRTLLLLGPDMSQYVSGQRWLACAIVPNGGSYVDSIRGGRNRLSANAFGQCRAAGRSGLTRVPCAHPHEVEIFGTAVGDDNSATAAIASCAGVLAAVTAMPDPTASGRLKVQIVPDRLLGRRNCAVQVLGDRLLHDSLLGWGGEPLPWS